MTRQKLFKALTGRLARNLYLWAFMLYTVIQMNASNERMSHYGIIYSPWYWPLIVVSTSFQGALIYTNNLVLVPKLLARRKVWQYILGVLSLVFTVSLFYTIGLKIAKPHINVDHLQQVGFVTSPVDTDWSLASLFAEMQTYMFGNMLWVFVFTMAWYMNDYSRQRRIAEEARRAQVSTELAFLKNQLNPHFLFNTLNNLYALALKKSDMAPDAILKLSSILRYLLYESNTPLVPFEKEAEIMRAYIDLELLRLKDHSKLKFEIDADAPKMIPPLLWLPVLENVFKYGTRIISEDSFVAYQFALQKDQLIICSRNTLKAMPNNELAKGIGLENLRKRLSLLYPGRYELESSPAGNEYITDIKINLS